MNIKKSNICALIVTYNRKDYLLNLLQALESQTMKLNKILIFDNLSNDGTGDFLIKHGYTVKANNLELTQVVKNNISIFYYRNDQNSGGSGGFHDGLDLAREFECDYIWAMDDDVMPDSECLANLIKHMSCDTKICIPSRSDELFQDYAITELNMSNPFKYDINMRKTKIKSNDIKGEYVYIKDMPFEGPLIATSLINDIGLPNKDFFIIFDDSEYAYRASKVTKLKYVKTAILHKQIIPQKCPNRKMGWKEYYGYRNQIYFDKIYGKNIFTKGLRPIFLYIDLITRSIYRKKWSNIKVINKAYKDGKSLKLGKIINPGTTGEEFK